MQMIRSYTCKPLEPTLDLNLSINPRIFRHSDVIVVDRAGHVPVRVQISFSCIKGENSSEA